jgi:hypothetical protein
MEIMNAQAAAFLPVVDQCEGCDRIVESASGRVCRSYLNPGHKWSIGTCNLASHVKVKVKKRLAVNPLKASKKAAGAA